MNSIILALALVGAAPSVPSLSENQADQLRIIQAYIQTAIDLNADPAYIAKFFAQAEAITGEKNLDQARLDYIVSNAGNRSSWLGNLLTLKNIIIFLSSLAGVIAFVWIVKITIWDVLKEMPPVIYEVSAYVLSFIGLFLGNYYGIYLAGAFLLLAGIAITNHTRFANVENWKVGGNVQALFVAIVWGAAALYHDSSTLGFLSIMSLETAMGFFLLITPLCYFIGFEDDDVVAGATGASFLMLTAYVSTFIAHVNWGHFVVFKTGMLWMGAFVFYIGCLILSSRYYTQNAGQYLIFNFLTFVMGLAAFYFGTVYNITPLLGIGGTFFALFILEKYYDIPWGEVGYAWSLAGLAAMGFYVAHLISKYPQYFVIHTAG